MRPAVLPITVSAVVVAGIVAGAIFYQTRTGPIPADPQLEPAAQLSPAASPSPGASPSPEASPSPGPSASPAAAKVTNPHPDLTVDPNGLSKTTVDMMTSRGLIKFKLYANDAPETVKRFVELVNQGFYNGLAFHKITPNFAIQGGDPQGTGQGGSGKRLKAEFNSRQHQEGTVGLARSPSDPDSGDSQFYIMLSRQPHLDRTYTVFGQVIEGMDIVRQIQKDDRIVYAVME
jgi:cyclophilin family peptidyl-prolyl cis-trans isomerase